MKAFVETFIEHINKLTTNQQLHNDFFINFRKKQQINSYFKLNFINEQNLNDFRNA